MAALSGSRRGDIIPDLKQVLEENFIKNEDDTWNLEGEINDTYDLYYYNGDNAHAIFDLKNAKLDKEVVINTCSVFGGIDIYVKEDTKVLIKSTSLFGGVENKKKTETNDKSKTIYINAFCMFGGVDIK